MRTEVGWKWILLRKQPMREQLDRDVGCQKMYCRDASVLVRACDAVYSCLIHYLAMDGDANPIYGDVISTEILFRGYVMRTDDFDPDERRVVINHIPEGFRFSSNYLESAYGNIIGLHTMIKPT